MHAAVPLDRDWLAWRLAGAASREALVPGDVRVPAPEQFEGRRVDEKEDV